MAFNSLYNYGNTESNGGSAAMNGSTNGGSNVGNSQSAVARSTSSHTLDLDQDNKKRKDLEYKWVPQLCDKIWLPNYDNPF